MVVLGDTAIIPLRRRSGEIADYAFVDPEDVERIGAHRWYLRPGGYAGRQQTIGRRKQQTILLHRAVLGLRVGDGIEVDHENLEKLDCRKANLRVCTHAQNGQNRRMRGGSSRFRGVSFRKDIQQWGANASIGGKQFHLGYFATEQEAADAASAWRAQHMSHTTN